MQALPAKNGCLAIKHSYFYQKFSDFWAWKMIFPSLNMFKLDFPSRDGRDFLGSHLTRGLQAPTTHLTIIELHEPTSGMFFRGFTIWRLQQVLPKVHTPHVFWAYHQTPKKCVLQCSAKSWPKKKTASWDPTHAVLGLHGFDQPIFHQRRRITELLHDCSAKKISIQLEKIQNKAGFRRMCFFRKLGFKIGMFKISRVKILWA